MENFTSSTYSFWSTSSLGALLPSSISASVPSSIDFPSSSSPGLFTFESSQLSWLSLSALLSPKLIKTLLAVLLYLLTVRLLRYRRRTLLSASYPTSSSLSHMTAREAQAIVYEIAHKEFPFLFGAGLQLALLRSYSIPSISQLLESTGGFTDPVGGAKRYADLIVLFAEFVQQDYATDGWVRALARVNCIHAPYERSGKIQNSHNLYTMALIAREPIRLMSKWEWRAFSETEKCAMGVWWAKVAEAMGISWEGLVKPTTPDGKWRNGIEWLESVWQWAEEYEAEYMMPAPANHVLVDATIGLLLYLVPSSLNGWAEKAVLTLMDQKLRHATLYPDPPRWLEKLVHGLMRIRGLLIRHLCLPRFEFNKITAIDISPNEQGASYVNQYLRAPWYAKATIANRWGPSAWMRRAQGIPVPGNQATTFCPMGYTSSANLGPRHGKKEQAAMEAWVRSTATRRYPSFIDPRAIGITYPYQEIVAGWKIGKNVHR